MRRDAATKNILVIQGRGRVKGNTAQLVNSFAEGARESGHSVEIVSLLKNEVNGCLGCNACRYGKPCVQKDSFNELVPTIKATDCIVFASPLYFWTVSSKIKAFIERFYCIAEEDPNPPMGRYEKYPVRDCALLMTSADDFFWTFEQAVSYYPFTLALRIREWCLPASMVIPMASRRLTKPDIFRRPMSLGNVFTPANNISICYRTGHTIIRILLLQSTGGSALSLTFPLSSLSCICLLPYKRF